MGIFWGLAVGFLTAMLCELTLQEFQPAVAAEKEGEGGISSERESEKEKEREREIKRS